MTALDQRRMQVIREFTETAFITAFLGANTAASC